MFNKDLATTFFLVAILSVLVISNVEGLKPLVVPAPDNINYDSETKTLELDSLTLKQKIAQMVIVYERPGATKSEQDMAIGGFYLDAERTKEDFIEKISGLQEGAAIPLFIATDMEGSCSNPFEFIQDFPNLPEIETKEEAFAVGAAEGELMREVGYNINFAPVVDLEDTVWNCRNFQGSPAKVAKKAEFYIKGLQSRGILATVKHYPGKTLLMDPHHGLTYATIDKEDLLPFEYNMYNNVSAVMITHTIASGEVNSEGKPSVASERLVGDVSENFNGLIITDDIRMFGLRNYYIYKDDMYLDLFKAENDVILQFTTNPKEVYRMISVIEQAVLDGEISEERIDKSVTKILNAKGITVI